MEVIRATSLLGFPELVTELGGDADELLHAAGIRPGDVGRPDVFIGLRGAMKAVEAAAAATARPDCGRRLAERQGIEILGPVGVAARTAATLADALSIFDGFMAAYSPGLSITIAQTDPRRCFLEWRVRLEPSPPQAQTVELSLGIMLRVLRLLLGSDYAPLSAHLPHQPLSQPGDYHRDYCCRAYFGCPATGFTLRAADLDRPLRQDPLVHQTAVNYLNSITADRTYNVAQSVADIVRHLLPGGKATVELVASQFGLHPKAFQRRLAAQGTTFVALVDDIRRETAERCLPDSDITLSHLTRQLGYAEQSVLTRSCQRWFGMSPTAYRNALRDGLDPYVAARSRPAASSAANLP